MMLLNDVLAPTWDGASAPVAVDGVLPAQQPALLGVKGAGDSLGVPLLRQGSTGLVPLTGRGSGPGGVRERRWKVSVRARGNVTLFRAKLEDLSRLVECHPEMASAVNQIATQQETDLMVAEAMRQLQLYNGAAVAAAAAAAAPCSPDVVLASS